MKLKYDQIRLMDDRIMVQFGYWFRFEPVPSKYSHSKMWWLMIQSAYWLNILLVPMRNH